MDFSYLHTFENILSYFKLGVEQLLYRIIRYTFWGFEINDLLEFSVVLETARE